MDKYLDGEVRLLHQKAVDGRAYVGRRVVGETYDGQARRGQLDLEVVSQGIGLALGNLEAKPSIHRKRACVCLHDRPARDFHSGFGAHRPCAVQQPQTPTLAFKRRVNGEGRPVRDLALLVIRVERHEAHQPSALVDREDRPVLEKLLDIRPKLLASFCEMRHLAQHALVFFKAIPRKVVNYDDLSHRWPPVRLSPAAGCRCARKGLARRDILLP